ncbi:MAG: hypothetical protein DLM72_08285 [Candidatus Nitrosopolaris wilkensis]|nr:MAG: hypothetical protein DLM72_08285 [Candidatus Nitrosopolaris wilkensis]
MPVPTRLLRPMAHIDLLNIPVYDIKMIEASFDLPDMNLKKAELHPQELMQRLSFRTAKARRG